VISRTFTLNQV